ncbi:MAG: hypothetical protein A2X34_05005 [Elusimicrobia bacterium GWC2_51_8]|nr:MAG: hypothetical protein A2X33_00445 [Elusimicrobia bacterium GWA2_51_34]OGR59838.1 MAG: hypothetical protein A2X34_05005 [Elusimicrobia bacterium GWC2_51_8]OGR84943.1 MAG: hypothetical protein A2021_05940 [Elusimicrobia bacterium GWF2_52_66]HAF96339.1 hypothetical protein [Elusimicrobiota bacterium]HCE98525.1 hypothetical protein [Elusimicrobiota bacterium]
MTNWKKYTLVAVIVTAAVFAHIKNSYRGTPSDLRDAVADNAKPKGSNTVISGIGALPKSTVAMPKPKALLSNANLHVAPVKLAWLCGNDFKVKHPGIDLGGEEAVYSPEGGLVQTGFDSYAGNYALVHTKNGGCQWFIHLRVVSPLNNKVIEPNTLLGKMGNTGKGSYGLHLHWEIRKPGACERSDTGFFKVKYPKTEEELKRYWVNPHDYRLPRPSIRKKRGLALPV